jgi:PAS domain S-box-containing protein
MGEATTSAMHKPRPTPSGRERSFGEHEIIVSKTDLTGRITYANDVFVRVSGYSERELTGQAHSIIRHPDMPRCVFKLLWDTLATGSEIFAYVVNMAANGDHYWVLAHVTPSRNPHGQVVGYHSNRRVPDRVAVDKASALYATLLAEERRHADRAAGMAASTAMVHALLASKGLGYDEFVFSLAPEAA